jgi:hypothetical protein
LTSSNGDGNKTQSPLICCPVMPWIQFTRRSVIACGDYLESSTDYAAVAGPLPQNVTIKMDSLATFSRKDGSHDPFKSPRI